MQKAFILTSSVHYNTLHFVVVAIPFNLLNLTKEFQQAIDRLPVDYSVTRIVNDVWYMVHDTLM